MFVLDSNDRERIDECKDEIWRLLAEEELQSCFFLVMANKKDLPNAMSVQEITDKLELNKIRDREWCKCSCTKAFIFCFLLCLFCLYWCHVALFT